METLRLIGLALRQRCRHEQDYALAWWERWVLTAKCIASLLLRRPLDREWDAYEANVTVALYDWRPTFDGEYSGADGWALLVRKYGMGAGTRYDGWP